jgi:hypothetical protein
MCRKRTLLAWLLAALISWLFASPGPTSAEEVFSKTSTIAVPNGLQSFDIGFVDPKLGLYFLADRGNGVVEQYNTSTTILTQLGKGAFVGLQAGSDVSGPNGVITANGHREVWAGDGVLCGGGNNNCGPTTPASQTSHVKVIDLATGMVTHSIDTGGQRRADELCYDPRNHLVMVANDDPLDLLLTFISTKNYTVVGKLKLDGSDANAKNISASNGIEQCQWNPRTGKIYVAIPQVGGTPGANDTPGVVLEINPASMKVQHVFPIDFGFVPANPSAMPPTAAQGFCLGPQGVAIGPDHQIMLGCSESGQGTVIIDERHGGLVENLPGLNGNDEIWYNPGDNHYFLAASNNTVAGPILGVVDQHPDNGHNPIDPSPATQGGSHSVAADPLHNQVFIPANNSSAALCGNMNGCIAVFTAKGRDDRGLCNLPATPPKDFDDDDRAFLRSVCPPNSSAGGEDDDR